MLNIEIHHSKKNFVVAGVIVEDGLDEVVAPKTVAVRKELGEDNAADLLTKHLAEEKASRFLEKLGFSFRDGRAAEAPNLAKGAAARRVASVVLAEAVVPMDHRQPGVHRKVAPG